MTDPLTPVFWLQLGSAILGGGLLVAIGNWAYNWRSTRAQREADHLREQLEGLYGPLHFITTQNEQLFRLVNAINGAYTVEFNKEWSQDQGTQDAIKAEATATIDLSNDYVKRAVANNDRAMALLEHGWHLVDSEDLEVLAMFQVDYTRFQVEVRDQARNRIPFTIYQALGEISYMRPTLIGAVAAAVLRKRARLEQLGWRESRTSSEPGMHIMRGRAP